MAITTDATSESAYNSDALTVTWSHTVSGSDRLLVVGVSMSLWDSPQEVTGVTYNGVALTRLRRDLVSTVMSSEIWYLVAPETGTHDIVVTKNDTEFGAKAGAVSFTGVDQTNPMNAHNGGDGDGLDNTVSTTVTTTVDDCFLFDTLLLANNDPADVTNGGATVQWSESNFSELYAGSTQSVGAAGSHDSTWLADFSGDWVHSLAAIAPSTSSGLQSPSVSVNSHWTSPDNVFTSNDTYSTSAANQTDYQRWRGFGFSIPTGATINGVEVTIEGKNNGATANGLRVGISGNSGSSYSSAKTTTDFTSTDTTKTLGDSSDLWGLSLTPSSFNSDAFYLRAQLSTNSSDLVDVDHIQAKVYYTTSSGESRTVTPVTSTFSIPTVTATTTSYNFYNSFKSDQLSGNVDLDTDTIKVALVTSSYTFDQDAHHFFSDITNEITGTGYTAGGETMSGISITADDTNDLGKFDANNTTWSSATFTFRGAVIYKDTGTASTSPLVAYIDFSTDQSASSEDVAIEWDTSGVFQLA